LGLVVVPNESELCGVFRYALAINPWNKDHLIHGLDVLNWVTRNNISTAWPDQCNIMRTWIDEVLQAVWQLNKLRGVSLEDFIGLHRANLHLVIQKNHLDIVTNCAADKLHEVTADVSAIVESSGAGAAIFHNVMVKVAGQWLDSIVKPHLTTFASADITEQSLVAVSTVIHDLISTKHEAQYCKDDKNAMITYRGLQLKVPVKSKEERFSYQLHAIIKGVGVESGALVELDVEKVLNLSKDHYTDKICIEPQLLLAAATARKVFDQSLKDDGCDSADTVNQLLTKRLPDLLTVDRKFRIEEALVLEVTGPRATSRLMIAVLNAFPVANTAIEPAHCLQNLQNLERQSIFKLAPRDSQAKVKVAIKLVEQLFTNRQPSLEHIKQDAFLSDVVTRLQYFLRVKNPDHVDDTQAEFLFGTDALVAKLADVQKSEAAGTLLMKDVADFTIYAHLVTPVIEAALKPIMKQLAGKASACHTKEPKKTKSASSSSTNNADDDAALQSAMAEFR
jgi:hypothetical protein